MEWSKDKTLRLINAIYIRPAIWNNTSIDYKNKFIRRDNLLELAELFKCTKKDIERKIANIRTQYSRELNKIAKSRTTTSEEVYEPKWFAFELLGFLRSGNASKETCVTVKQEPNDFEEMPDEYLLGDLDEESRLRDNTNEEMSGTSGGDCDEVDEDREQDIMSPSSDIHDGNLFQVQPFVNILPADGTLKENPHRKRKEAESFFMRETTSALRSISETQIKMLKRDELVFHNHRNVKDECDIFGESVATQLRNVKDPYARSMAKLNIQKALFEAETRNFADFER